MNGYISKTEFYSTLVGVLGFLLLSICWNGTSHAVVLQYSLLGLMAIYLFKTFKAKRQGSK